ncbi:MAG: sulfatase, partial [Planctomycetaceae bacterium]
MWRTQVHPRTLIGATSNEVAMQRFPPRARIVLQNVCLALLLSVYWTAIAEPAQAERPNILFAFADDWGRYASAYAALAPGGPSDVVKTPNFDRVAGAGVLFRHAFVTAPSCTPCRSSLLSGQYFWRTGRGAILQGAVWDPQIPTFPLILKDGGYHIGHSYKVWSPGTPANAPYGSQAYAYNKRGNRFNGFSQVVSRSNDPQKTRDAVLHEVRDNFRDFLADRKHNEPFCYWFGPTNCHRKWIQGSGKALWGLNPDDLRGKLPAFLPDHEVVRQDVCDYLGDVHAFDAALGVLLNEPRRIGAADNTLIIVSGDHGMPGMPRGKCNLYDFGVAVPLAVSWKGHVPAARVCDDFVNLMDLAPTLLDAAGSKIPAVMTGRS